MNFIEIKNVIINLNEVRYIDTNGNYEDELGMLFQFERDDVYTVIKFDNESELNFWMHYLRKYINR